MSDTPLSRREALSLLGAAGAVLALGVPGRASAQSRTRQTQSALAERSTADGSAPEIVKLEAPISELDPKKYQVSEEGGSTTPVSARILCQPAGTSVYYSDHRDAEGVLHIDMTKEVKYP